ncbi:MAG: hypothetical protein HYX38_01015 [Rhodospirillales bacterium]|nr:hypothetical protein [Rhodospirillales bacterium]
MQSNHHHARPVVLRELSLLRALGASLRTNNRPGRPKRVALSLSHPPQPPDAFALLPRTGLPPVSKLK